MTVLVAYASVHGSTRGVAERIASRIAAHGMEVDCLPVDQVDSLDAYDSFVIGSAIHNQAWLPEARRFATDNAAVLWARPVWLFSVGMPGALGRPLRRWARVEGPKVLDPITRTIGSRGEHLFSGVVAPGQLSAFGRAVFRLMGGHWGDFRNWPAIDDWADGIASALEADRHEALDADTARRRR